MKGKKILIVDDDPGLLRLISMYLAMEGFEVKTLEDSESALAYLNTNPTDLVILDIMMPGMDGIEACAVMKANPLTQHIPVVIFTALSGETEQERARVAGADDFINKPFSLTGLGERIQELLNR